MSKFVSKRARIGESWQADGHVIFTPKLDSRSVVSCPGFPR